MTSFVQDIWGRTDKRYTLCYSSHSSSKQ